MSGIDDLFRKTLALSPTEQAIFLIGLPDPERWQLEEMLAAHSASTGTELKSPSGLRPTEIGPAAGPFEPELHAQIGPYRILQSIGRGGMGKVYMAEQTEPVKRRVALKVIKTDTPTKEILARFEAERQALAMMDHQNIAKVLDAGVTEDGRPYFAMELVRGVPINEYCDKNKLRPNERLGLFVQTCRAIQHAHQKGIIHRDIKPSNVLVTLYDGKPVAKVIDFGLAKALQEQIQLTNRTMFTQFGQVVGTLAYMSPEQAEMNAMDVDTRTDVYSLGVVLYELLTGSTPLRREQIRSEAFDRVLALIREYDTPRPSIRLSDSGEAIAGISARRQVDPRRLSSILRGELDWIAIKALEKDRSRRYESASALADDVERYLNDEAVVARPPNVTYRLGKAVRKHRSAFVTAFIVLSALILGIVATGTAWWEASRAREDAIAAATAAESAENEARTAEESERSQRRRADNALAVVEKQQKQLSRTLALSLTDQGVALCASGQQDRGLTSLASALDVVDTGSPLHQSIRQLLLGWTPDGTRTFYHPAQIADQSARHSGASLSEPSQRLFTHCADGQTYIWDITTGRLVLLHGGENYLVSPDGRLLVCMETSSDTETAAKLHCYDLLTAEELWSTPAVFSWYHKYDDVFFSSDSSVCLVTDRSRNKVQRLDAMTGHETVGGIDIQAETFFWAKHFDSENQRLVGVLDFRLAFWDSSSGRLVGPSEPYACNPESTVRSTARGERMIVVGGLNSAIQIWNPQTATPVGEPIPPTKFACSGQLPILVLAGPTSTKIVNVDSGSVIGTIPLPAAVPAATRSTSGNITSRNQSAQSLDLSDGHLLSPDGAFIVVLQEEQPLIVGIVDLQRKGDLLVSDGQLIDYRWSRDGRFMLTARTYDESVAPLTKPLKKCRKIEVRLWDIETSRPIGEPLWFDDGLLDFTFTRDSTAFVTCSNHELQVFSGVACEAIGRPTQVDAKITQFRLHDASGQAVLCCDDRTCRVIELGKLLPEIDRESSTGTTYPLNAVRLSRSSGHSAVASSDWTVTIQPATAEDSAICLQHGAPVRTICFSPDGTKIASGGDDQLVRIWDVAQANQTQGPLWHRGKVTSIAYSPDGDHLLTGCDDGIARLWDSSTGRLVARLEHLAGVGTVDVAPDGQHFLTVSDDETAHIWDANSLERIGKPLLHDSAIHCARFSADGSEFITASRVVQRWDTKSQQTTGRPMSHPSAVVACDVSSDGRRIVTATENRSWRIWDVETGYTVGPEIRMSFNIRDIQFSVDETSVIMACEDGTLRWWDLPSDSQLADDLLRDNTELLTTQRVDSSQRRLTFDEWRQRSQRLRDSGALIGALAAKLTETQEPGSESDESLLRDEAQVVEQRLTDIVAAMRQFYDVHGRFPARSTVDQQGQPLLSWRVQLLPFLGEGELFNEFHHDEAWDSEHNRTLTAKMPAVYQHPLSVVSADGRTCFQVPVADGTMFGSARGARLRNITDGTNKTIAVVVVDEEAAKVWTSPGDIQLTQLRSSIGDWIPNSCQVVNATGLAGTIPCGVPESVFPIEIYRSYFTIQDGQSPPEIGTIPTLDQITRFAR